MPTKRHPKAVQVRDLIADEQFRLAEPLLMVALKAEPRDPDLLTERARLLLYQARESESFKLLIGLPKTNAAIEVAQPLANHFHCTILASGGSKACRRDDGAPSHLKQLHAKFGVKVEATAGIRISACLIVKDEEAHLDRCLKSLKGLADEIVIVDTGSTDRTVEIAEKHGAKIGHFAWCGDFSAARNVSLELATGNWILWIDADEEVTPDSRKLIKNAAQRPQFGGFNIEIVNFTADGNDESQYTHSPIRFFQNLPSVRFEGRIHEQICNSLKGLGLPGATLEGARILHNGYRPSEMAAKDKVARTLELLQKEVLDHPSEPFHWFNLCNALFVANRWAEAEHAGRQCARNLKDGDPYGALNYQLLIGALAAQNKLTGALRVCDEAAMRGFGGILVDFERANVHLRADEPVEALRAIDRCMQADWPEGMTGDRSIHTFKRFIVRGQALAILSRGDEAIEMFDHALSVVPNYASALYCKAATLEKMGELQESLKLFLQAQDDPAVRQLCIKGAARTSLHLGLAKESAALFQTAWESDPDDYDCWVGWVEAATASGNPDLVVIAYEAFAQRSEPTVEVLINWGRALQASGQHDRAMALFTEAMRRDPQNPNAYFNCGDLLYAQGQYSDAAHIYEAGLRQNPQHADGWFVLGNCFARMGMEDGAKLAFNQALLLDPAHAGASHNLECLAA